MMELTDNITEMTLKRKCRKMKLDEECQVKIE